MSVSQLVSQSVGLSIPKEDSHYQHRFNSTLLLLYNILMPDSTLAMIAAP